MRTRWDDIEILRAIDSLRNSTAAARSRPTAGTLWTGSPAPRSPPTPPPPHPAGRPVHLARWPDGPHRVIQIADSGPGIDHRHLPFPFERVWRADKSRSRQTGGNRLGLAITRKLAEAHHGTVSAANGDEGAVFTLRIPASQPNRPVVG